MTWCLAPYSLIFSKERVGIHSSTGTQILEKSLITGARTLDKYFFTVTAGFLPLFSKPLAVVLCTPADCGGGPRQLACFRSHVATARLESPRAMQPPSFLISLPPTLTRAVICVFSTQLVGFEQRGGRGGWQGQRSRRAGSPSFLQDAWPTWKQGN